MLPKLFTVSEYNSLRVGDRNQKGDSFTVADLEILRSYYGNSETGIPYFSPGDRCIWFRQYVGVLQVEHLTIEVLPKTDNADDQVWRDKLVGMLQKVYQFDVSVTGISFLSLKNNSILSYYCSLFVAETKKLLHQGLVKKYRNITANSPTFRGKLLLNKDLTRNYIHKERFFVSYAIYDRENIYNRLLYMTLKTIRTISHNTPINDSASALLLDFPEMNDIPVSEELFKRLRFDQKTDKYKTAIGIARLLLLHYHPDLRRGQSHVLALMFDMNELWEKFVYVTLRKQLRDYDVHEQVPKVYWKGERWRAMPLKPDIRLSKENTCYIIDTKWKLLGTGKPSSQDLQQMFAYTEYFSSLHTLLLYPGPQNSLVKGYFYPHERKKEHTLCSVAIIGLDAYDSIQKWQDKIASQVRGFVTKSG